MVDAAGSDIPLIKIGQVAQPERQYEMVYLKDFLCIKEVQDDQNSLNNINIAVFSLKNQSWAMLYHSVWPE